MKYSQIESTGESRGSFKSYATGFGLSILLTVIAFALVMGGIFSLPGALFGIVVAAVVQILIHLHYFLHLSTSSAMRWNIMALLFTLLIMFIFVGGSIWIMYNLNYRMM